MNLLGIDIGSSSVKCALLRNGKVAGKIVHAPFPTIRDGAKVEVEPAAILKAVFAAAQQLGKSASRAEAVALSVMSPAWVAMDAKGEALTNIVTHQDRRSVAEALELEKKVGKQRYLNIAGTRPFPGGISSTTWAWFGRHEPGRIRKADLVGHLNTYLHRQFTGSRVVDTANASFMGVYSTVKLDGWNAELCEAVGAKASQLPELHDANEIGGKISRLPASRLGVLEGTPMVVGVVDGSAGMLAAGAQPGQIVNVCGSTDVLALCASRAVPHERLLTRALGIGRLWLSVSTIAAAGSAIAWAKEQLFADKSWPEFEKLALKLALRETETGTKPTSSVRFDPYLAGDRMSIEQKQAAFSGLTLGSTREDLLAAMLECLAETSAARLELLEKLGLPMRRKVVVTGGAQKINSILHRDWPGRWDFRNETEATLKGLAKLEPR
ncbi:MAG TPA: FGGY family carbohydrate kinase [Tepidisphaeraceae bacterium]|nr:FGGY family carbohydrate kinase [Tepidisphaeraceae bacterium]